MVFDHPFLPFKYETARLPITWLNVKFTQDFDPIKNGQVFKCVDLYFLQDKQYIECLDENWSFVYRIPINLKVEIK